MENEASPTSPIRSFVRWAMTPPQAYVAYLVCFFLVAGVSFYVGTLRPRHVTGIGPPPISAPRN